VTRDAVLYLASPDDSDAARLPVAGRPLAFRVIMAAVRAGVRRVAVPASLRDAALEAAIARTPSARRAVDWLTPGAAAPPAAVVLLPAGTLVTAPTVAALLASPPAAIVAGSAGGAPVATVAAPAVAPVWRALARGEAVGAGVARAVAPARVVIPASGGLVEPVATADALRGVEARLLESLGNPVDTALDRAFHRRLSAPITRWAMARGISANAVTIASIAIGLGAAAAAAVNGIAGAVAALALYVAAVVLDHADGEIARLGFSESRLGERLDIFGDTVVHMALVAGMGIAAARVSGASTWLGVVAALGVVLSAWVWKTSRPAAAGVGRVFVVLGNRDGFYAALLAFVAAVGLAPAALPALMALLAAGTHAYWVGAMLSRLRRANT
jgi:phosphatidylglycerophosphate synthase